MPAEPNERFLEGLHQKMRQRAELLAQQTSKDGLKQLTSEEQSLLWNRRHLTLEQEWELWRIGRTPGDTRPPLSREQIGLMVFKDRERLVKSGGRIEPAEFTPWANRTAEREAAKRNAAAAPLLDPPDPLPLPDPPPPVMQPTSAPLEMAGLSRSGGEANGLVRR